jgi:hypothetical protein
VHFIGFRKRERLAHKSPKMLPNSIVETLDVCCFTGFFANGFMLLVGNDCLKCFPKAAIAHTLAVRDWNGIP